MVNEPELYGTLCGVLDCVVSGRLPYGILVEDGQVYVAGAYPDLLMLELGVEVWDGIVGASPYIWDRDIDRFPTGLTSTRTHVRAVGDQILEHVTLTVRVVEAAYDKE